MTRRTLELAYAGEFHTVHFDDANETIEDLKAEISDRGYLTIQGEYVKDGQKEVGPWTYMSDEIVWIL